LGGEPLARMAGELPTLGRRLFADARLSRDSSISCATCHNPDHGFAEARPISRGIGANAPRRNAQSLLDVGRQYVLTWDGRLHTLEDQVEEAFTEDGDMGISIATAVARVGSDPSYVAQFRRVLGRAPDAQGIAKAISEFERTLRAAPSRFDCFLFFGDSTALTASERRGWDMFTSRKAGCSGCHSPFEPDPPRLGIAWFSDRRFHNLGVGFADGSMSDSGRAKVSRRSADLGAFRTPSLRNVALTPPYMHDGSLTSLEAVVAFYVRGGVPNARIDAIMIPRAISLPESEDLVAFLRALTSISTTSRPSEASTRAGSRAADPATSQASARTCSSKLAG
jgi:cytochrome c peroxidase